MSFVVIFGFDEGESYKEGGEWPHARTPTGGCTHGLDALRPSHHCRPNSRGPTLQQSVGRELENELPEDLVFDAI